MSVLPVSRLEAVVSISSYVAPKSLIGDRLSQVESWPQSGPSASNLGTACWESNGETYPCTGDATWAASGTNGTCIATARPCCTKMPRPTGNSERFTRGNGTLKMLSPS